MASFANVSQPTDVVHACHVEWDEESGTFKGLPDVWAGLVPKGTSRQETDTRAMSRSVAPQRPTKKMMKKAKEEEKEQPMMIGAPFNVQHIEHVGVDARSSTGFTGLPDDWSVFARALAPAGPARPHV